MKILVSMLVCLAGLIGPAWSAETIDVSDNHGGNVRQYDARWAEYGRQGVRVRIVGPCQSACTVLLAHIPRGNICVTGNASLGFHLAKSAYGTATLWNAYPADIQAWINARGGLKGDFVWLRSPELHKYFGKC
jgi:hypothetical protein